MKIIKLSLGTILSLSLFILYNVIYTQPSPPLALTAGKTIFKTQENKIYLETAHNRRPTLRQIGIVLIADYMIYDETLKIGYAYGNLRFADTENNTFMTAKEGTFFIEQDKIVLREAPSILFEQSPSKSTKIEGSVITLYPKDSYVHVQGNVQIDDGSTFITGKEAKIWTKEDKMKLINGVEAIAEDQKLSADTLDVNFSDGDLQSYIASGDVKTVNTLNNFTICSKVLTYNHSNKLYRATEEALIYFNKRDTISFANVIEYDENTEIGTLLGDVTTVQKEAGTENKNYAYSRWAIYNQEEELLRMYGNPRLVQPGSELFGQQIVVDVENNNMKIISSGQGFFDKEQ